MRSSEIRYGLFFWIVYLISLCLQPESGTAQKVVSPHEVPVLCYHQVRPHKSGDGKMARAITIPPHLFAAHMRMLHDSGYTPVLPERLYAYYTNGTPLPPHPVVITFDDNTLSQYTAALPELNRYGFKAVFFIMTVTIGKAGYMSAAQLKQLQSEGHTLGGHTWDHPDLRKLSADGWPQQIDRPLKSLAGITGQPVYDFAYPYGAWNEAALLQLKQRGIRMAFILNTPPDAHYPLLTHRRLMVLYPWSAATLDQKLKKLFGN